MKLNNNKTDDQNPLKPFLSDREDPNIKSEEVSGYNNSPTLNIKEKTKKEDNSAPNLPQIGLIWLQVTVYLSDHYCSFCKMDK